MRDVHIRLDPIKSVISMKSSYYTLVVDLWEYWKKKVFSVVKDEICSRPFSTVFDIIPCFHVHCSVRIFFLTLAWLMATSDQSIERFRWMIGHMENLAGGLVLYPDSFFKYKIIAPMGKMQKYQMASPIRIWRWPFLNLIYTLHLVASQ